MSNCHLLSYKSLFSKQALCRLNVFKVLIAPYLRFPPDKRPNYLKLGTASPFKPPLDILVKDWSDGFKGLRAEVAARNGTSASYFVIRETRLLAVSLKHGQDGSDSMSATGSVLAPHLHLGLVPVKVETDLTISFILMCWFSCA